MFPIVSNEEVRLAVQPEHRILDTADEVHFDVFCRLARDLFAVPVAEVALIKQDRLPFKANRGMALARLIHEGGGFGVASVA